LRLMSGGVCGGGPEVAKKEGRKIRGKGERKEYLAGGCRCIIPTENCWGGWRGGLGGKYPEGDDFRSKKVARYVPAKGREGGRCEKT